MERILTSKEQNALSHAAGELLLDFSSPCVILNENYEIMDNYYCVVRAKSQTEDLWIYFQSEENLPAFDALLKGKIEFVRKAE